MTRTKRGEGECGSPDCTKARAPDRLVCKDHAEIMDRIREELFGGDYRARYMHDGNEMAPVKKKRPKLGPTCCFVGCYEPRNPGTPFCHAHQGNESD